MCQADARLRVFPPDHLLPRPAPSRFEASPIGPVKYKVVRKEGVSKQTHTSIQKSLLVTRMRVLLAD